MENQNKPEQLQAITARILQNLKNLDGAPSVQMHPVPPDWAIQSTSIQQMEGTTTNIITTANTNTNTII